MSVVVVVLVGVRVVVCVRLGEVSHAGRVTVDRWEHFPLGPRSGIVDVVAAKALYGPVLPAAARFGPGYAAQGRWRADGAEVAFHGRSVGEDLAEACVGVFLDHSVTWRVLARVSREAGVVSSEVLAQRCVDVRAGVDLVCREEPAGGDGFVITTQRLMLLLKA